MTQWEDTHTFRRHVFFMTVWLITGASFHFYWPWAQAFPFCALGKYHLLYSDVPVAGRQPGDGVNQQQVGCSISVERWKGSTMAGGVRGQGAWVSRGIWCSTPPPNDCYSKSLLHMLTFSPGVSNSALIFQLANKEAPGVSQRFRVWLDSVITPTYMQCTLLYFIENKALSTIRS